MFFEIAMIGFFFVSGYCLSVILSEPVNKVLNCFGIELTNEQVQHLLLFGFVIIIVGGVFIYIINKGGGNYEVIKTENSEISSSYSTYSSNSSIDWTNADEKNYQDLMSLEALNDVNYEEVESYEGELFNWDNIDINNMINKLLNGVIENLDINIELFTLLGNFKILLIIIIIKRINNFLIIKLNMINYYEINFIYNIKLFKNIALFYKVLSKKWIKK